MDDIERQFLTTISKSYHNNVSSKMTDGMGSKFTGFDSGRNENIARRIVRESGGRGDVGSQMTSPQYHGGDFNNMDNNLEPIQITSDMINEIRELEGDIILPEYANRVKLSGNPSASATPKHVNPQSTNIGSTQSDPNQIEMNFDKVSVETIYDQYNDIMKHMVDMKKELKIVKGLVETLIK